MGHPNSTSGGTLEPRQDWGAETEGGSVAQFVVKDEGLFNHIEWHKSIMLMREVDRRRTFFCIDGGWTMLHVRRSIPTCRRRRRRMRCSVASVIALSCLVVSSNVVSCSVSPAGTSATRRIYASTYEGAFVISMIRHGRRAEERQADPMEHVDLITQHPINSAYDALMDTDAESVRKASRLNEGYGDSTALMDTDAESVRKASLLNEGYEDSTAIVNGDSPNLVSIDPKELIPDGTCFLTNYCYQGSIFGCLGRVDVCIIHTPTLPRIDLPFVSMGP